MANVDPILPLGVLPEPERNFGANIKTSDHPVLEETGGQSNAFSSVPKIPSERGV
jgi:hypothetical protein